jgi:hypothetical protein
MNVPLSVVKYCAQEVERQHAGPLQVYDMVNAWDFAFHMSSVHKTPRLRHVITIATLVESNRQINPIMGEVNYRHTVVSKGSSFGPVIGSHPADIDRAMSHWYESKPQPNLRGLDELTGEWQPYEFFMELWIKGLLDIHPWADGNGRTASIVRNWMCGTLGDPTPLPFYYGEHDAVQGT